MKLLIEQIDEYKYLTEESDSKKHLYIEGVYLQSERKNRNGRIYPKSIIEREVARYLREKVEGKCAWGELGHPDTPSINLDRTAMRIVSLKNEGNDWVGKAMVQNTPHGNIVRSLIEDGGRLGVSSRGVGSIKMVEGVNMVQDDFHLATAADVVADPSAPDAYVRGLMEGKEWVWNNGLIQEANIAQLHKEVKTTNRKHLEEMTLKSFQKFIKLL
jgi:hypothetical protein